MTTSRRLGALFLATVLSATAVAHGADTTETFAVGLSDAEFYFGLDGVGKQASARRLAGELLIGVGLLPRLSACFGVKLSGATGLGQAEPALGLGLFGTPIDTAHFDLDVGFELQVGGDGMGDFTVAPWLELNLDAAPNLAWMGLYGRLKAVLTRGPGDAGISEDGAIDFTLEPTLGAYYTLSTGHQLLLEYELALHPQRPPGVPFSEPGKVTLGYNLCLSGELELVSGVAVSLPSNQESASLSVVVGVIATLGGPS